jgi:hypothetical protein
MRRDLGQMSLADGLVNQRAGRNGWLDRIGSIVDWPAVVKVLDGIYATAINLRRALVIAARQPECA